MGPKIETAPAPLQWGFGRLFLGSRLPWGRPTWSSKKIKNFGKSTEQTCRLRKSHGVNTISDLDGNEAKTSNWDQCRNEIVQNVICIIVCLHVVSPKGGSQLSLVRVLWISLITNVEFVLGGVHFSDQAKLFGSIHEGILLLCSVMKRI